MKLYTRFLFLIFTISLSIYIFSFKERTIAYKYQVRTTKKVAPIKERKDSVITIKLSVVGDLMSHLPQTQNAKTGDNLYDYNPSFESVREYLSNADFTFGNLETTCSGGDKGYSGYPAFNTPDDFVTAIKNSGIDMLVTANNHSMDMGEKGLLRTIDVIKQNRLGYTGTFKTQRDRDSVRMVDLKGLKIGFLAYTYGTNSLLPDSGNEFMLNIIDTTLIKKDILSARKQGAEIVLVYFHYGTENVNDPTAAQKKIVKKTGDYGADIIIGSHPHVISPTAFFKTTNAKLDTGFIAYSLGNFLSNQYWRYTDAGVILNISLTKNFTKNLIAISSVDFIPTWVYRGTNPLKKMHIIFPAEWSNKDSIAPFIDEELKKKMKEAYEDTKEVMTRYTNRVRINGSGE